MSAPPRTIVPAPGARACFNCTAWSRWDHIAVGQDGPGGFSVVGRKPTGECRAAPPTRDPEAIGGTNAGWPVVTATDWCRAFEARTTAQEAS